MKRSTDCCRVARVLKTVADETRLEILSLLAAKKGELCACEIEEHFDLSQPTMSHHLKLLREAGLVTSEKRGLWVYYALDRKAIARALGELGALVGLPKKGTSNEQHA